MAFFITRSIRNPKKYNSQVFLEEMYQQAYAVGHIIKGYFEKTVEFWMEQPDFDIDVNPIADGLELYIGTDDKVYTCLDSGTQIRWAFMPGINSSMTKPGTLSTLNTSPMGRKPMVRGKTGFMSVGLRDPMPGIDARDFTGQIYNIVRPIFRRDMDNAAKRGARRMEK